MSDMILFALLLRNFYWTAQKKVRAIVGLIWIELKIGSASEVARYFKRDVGGLLRLIERIKYKSEIVNDAEHIKNLIMSKCLT